MLNLSSRTDFQTLLDALVLRDESGSKDAIIYLETGKDPEKISKKKFRQIVFNYAAALQSLGVGSRDLVIIAHTQNLESIYIFWGAMLVGAIPSMFPTLTEKLNPQIYMDNMAELVNISGAKAVLTSDDFETILNDHLGCPVFGSSRLSHVLEKPVSQSFELFNPDPGAVAFLQHSSGTTGLQKGVALTHQAVLNQLASYSEAILLNENDVIVSWLPLYHDMGLIAGFLLPLVQGLPLVLMSPFDWVRHPALMLRAIDNYQGTLCWLPNFAYNHSARRIRQRDSEGISLASMRMFINCSEPVRRDSHELFLERFAENGLDNEALAVSYAMAENTFGVTQTPPGKPANLDVINRLDLEKNNLAVPVDEKHENAVIKVSCGTSNMSAQWLRLLALMVKNCPKGRLERLP